MDRDAPTLRADKTHTVRELTGRLLELVRLGYADAGFPVLVKEPAADREGRTFPTLRILGFLGINELEHALNELADEPDAEVNLIPDDTLMRSSRLSIFSFSESHEGRHNPYDLSQYIDRVSQHRCTTSFPRPSLLSCLGRRGGRVTCTLRLPENSIASPTLGLFHP